MYQPILTEKEWSEGDLFSFMVYRCLKNAKEDYPNHPIAAFLEGEIENPTFVDDIDDRTVTFYVDIPNPNLKSEEWISIKSFKTEIEAIEFAMEKFNANNQGMVSLISKS